MARKETNPYGYREFYRDLKAGRLFACYVLEGEEEFVKEQALQALTAAVAQGPMQAMNVTRLNDPGADALIAANETLPFMADRRLVVVRESGMLSGKAGDYDEEDSAARLRKYFMQLPSTSILVFHVRGSADKRKRLYKALADAAKAGQCALVTFDQLPESDLIKWVERACREKEVTCPAEMASRIIFRTGSAVSVLKGETDKLCDYLGPGGTVDEEAVNAVITSNLEYKVFDLASSVLQGDGQTAFRMLDELLYDGEDRLYLLALLGGQCRNLLKASLLASDGARSYDIASALGIPEFAVRQILALSRRFKAPEMARMTDLCVRTEFQVKSGAIPDEGSLEKVMLEILSMGGSHGKAQGAAGA